MNGGLHKRQQATVVFEVVNDTPPTFSSPIFSEIFVDESDFPIESINFSADCNSSSHTPSYFISS